MLSNSINIYGLTKLRFLLNKYIFNPKLNELLQLIQNETNVSVNSVDYLSHKFIICKDNELDGNILIRHICTIVCKFLSKYKLDIEVAIDTLEREDEKELVRQTLDQIIIGNHVHMIMNIMNLSNTEDKMTIMIQL